MTTNIKIQHKTWLDISKLDYFYYISKMQSHSILALAKLLCSTAMSLVGWTNIWVGSFVTMFNEEFKVGYWIYEKWYQTSLMFFTPSARHCTSLHIYTPSSLCIIIHIIIPFKHLSTTAHHAEYIPNICPPNYSISSLLLSPNHKRN